MKRWPTLALAWLLSFAAALAGPPSFRSDPDYLIDRWETEDGLPENSATAMVQDDEGYLWFGTFGGLVRFDGIKFTVVHPPLPSNGVVNLYFDRAHRLWVSTYGGVAVREAGRWRTITADDGWKGDFVRTFSERADGALLVTAFDGHVLEFVDGRFTDLPRPPGMRGTAFLGAVDAAGKWCAAHSKFVGQWDGAKWTPLVPEEELQGLANDAVGIAPARDGGLWILLGNSLRKFRGGAQTARIPLTESPGGVWSIFEDSAGQVWISSYNAGLSRVSPDGTLRRWSTANGSHHALRFIFEDRERNIWVGTSGGGLQRFKPRRFHAYGPECGLVERNISSLSPTRQGVLVGTYGGGLFRLENGRATPLALPGVAHVQSVLSDRAGRIWVGSFAQGLWVLEKGIPRRIPDELVGGGNVIALFEDSLGRIWISGGQKVAIFESGNVRELASPPTVPGQPPEAAPLFGVNCFAEDSTGHIWLTNGVAVYRVENDRCVAVLDGGAAIAGVSCLHAQRDALWLCSAKRGLLRWRDGALARIPSAAFPSAISGIVEDAQGSWWMLGSRGIVRAAASELEAAASANTVPRFFTFDLSDGLPSIEGADGRLPVCGRDAEGRLWFATRKGVASIDPAQFRPNPLLPSVHFETLVYRVLRNNAEVETRLDLSGLTPRPAALALPPGSRRIEFHFAAPSFSAPEKMRFELRLHDAGGARVDDIQWLEAGSRRVVEMFDRPPGEFTLSVRAANDDGVWSEIPATVAFSVAPFYWQTTSFLVAVGFGLTLFGGAWTWLFVHARWRRAAERERAAHEIRDLAGRLIGAQEAERTRIARELHDDLSQSIALMSVRCDLLAQHPPAAEEFLGQMRELSGQAQRISTEMHRLSHELHPAKLEQLGLVPALRGFCREMAAAHALEIGFTHDGIPEGLPLKMALCLYRVAQESLHNVVKHANATHAGVRLTAVGQELRLVITDDGIGFDPETPQAKSSLGFVSMRERVRLADGRLEVKSRQGQGTRVEVVVPAHEA